MTSLRLFLLGLAAMVAFPGCYTYRQRMLTVRELPSRRPAAHREIAFSNAEILLIPPRQQMLKARLDHEGRATMRLPTLTQWVSIEPYPMTMVFSRDIRRGGIILLGENHQRGVTSEALRMGSRAGSAPPPKYEVEIARP